MRIAEALNMPPSTIYSVVKRCKLRGTVVSPKPTGRPRKLTTRDKRQLKRILVQYRRITLSGLSAIMTKKVSPNTLKTTLKSPGFRKRIAEKSSIYIKNTKQSDFNLHKIISIGLLQIGTK